MSHEKRSNPPPAPDGETDRKILVAARAEFARHGLAGGRVERIAAAAEVNKAMIYYHFKSKENLYLEAVLAVLKAAAGTVVELTEEDGSLEDLLLKISDFYYTLFSNNPDYRAILLRELATPDSPIIKELGSRFAVSGLPDALMGRLQAAKDAGELRDINVPQALLSFILMHVGYYAMAPIVAGILDLKNEPAFIEERKFATVDLFLNGARRKS